MGLKYYMNPRIRGFDRIFIMEKYNGLDSWFICHDKNLAINNHSILRLNKRIKKTRKKTRVYGI